MHKCTPWGCEDNLYSRAMWWTHAPTFNKWHKKKKKKKNTNKKVTLHMLTHGTIWGCGLTCLMICIHDKFRDIRERNVTIRSHIWTTNITSLWFQDIRECVTLWRLILWSLRCINRGWNVHTKQHLVDRKSSWKQMYHTSAKKLLLFACDSSFHESPSQFYLSI